MGRLLGALAAVITWLGWLTICPALGLPTLATAAMFNLVLVPREDPGSWPGSALLLIGLASAALLYGAAADRGRLRPSIASGAVYGALCWLIAGAVVMPLLGVIAPAPASTTTAPPDPMRGSFMMLNLGVGAPIAALVAWVMFGVIVGATAGWRPDGAAVRRLLSSRSGPPGDARSARPSSGSARPLVLGAAIAAVAIVAVGMVVVGLMTPPADTSAPGTVTLDTEQLQALPAGADFFSVIELWQPPGATLGPHIHTYAGFACSIKGVATIGFSNGTTDRIGPGQVGFIGTQVTHSHQNTDDRLPGAALALLIIALVAAVGLIWSRPARRNGPLFAVALVFLVAAGALGTVDPWSNDWLFVSVRAVALRGAEMPVSTSSRLFESPTIGPLAPGPYIETLQKVTVTPAAPATDAASAAITMLFVLDGRVAVQPAGGSSTQVGARGATELQPGVAVQITDTGDQPAHVLKLTLISAAPGA